MKTICTALFLIIATAGVAQPLGTDDFRTLIPFLQQQDYKGAFEKSEALLKASDADTSDVRAQVAYINIYAAAGMVTQDQMTHKDFEQNVKRFVGKKLKMPGHPCVSDSIKVAYNSFQFKKRENGKMQGYTMTANQKKTNILLFEYYDFRQEVDPQYFIGNNVRATGILQSFEVNPNPSKTWIGRLHLSPCHVRLFKPN